MSENMVVWFQGSSMAQTASFYNVSMVNITNIGYSIEPVIESYAFGLVEFDNLVAVNLQKFYAVIETGSTANTTFTGELVFTNTSSNGVQYFSDCWEGPPVEFNNVTLQTNSANLYPPNPYAVCIVVIDGIPMNLTNVDTSLDEQSIWNPTNLMKPYPNM